MDSMGVSLSPGSTAMGKGFPRAGPRLVVYLMPRNSGCSPGAEVALSFLRLSMCAREMTVAETYQGRPVTEVTTIRRETQRRSRWKPAPFCRGEGSRAGGIFPLSWPV